jgi:hypothetical protein
MIHAGWRKPGVWIEDEPIEDAQIKEQNKPEGAKVIYVDRDAALRELHQSLQRPLAEDEVERRQLSKMLLPHVRRFYAGYFDPEAHRPYYRGSARQ